MLILDREIGQSIVIDNDIVVKILSQEAQFIRIGIQAPRSKTILREELVKSGHLRRRKGVFTREQEDNV